MESFQSEDSQPTKRNAIKKNQIELNIEYSLQGPWNFLTREHSNFRTQVCLLIPIKRWKSSENDIVSSNFCDRKNLG